KERKGESVRRKKSLKADFVLPVETRRLEDIRAQHRTTARGKARSSRRQQEDVIDGDLCEHFCLHMTHKDSIFMLGTIKMFGTILPKHLSTIIIIVRVEVPPHLSSRAHLPISLLYLKITIFAFVNKKLATTNIGDNYHIGFTLMLLHSIFLQMGLVAYVPHWSKAYFYLWDEVRYFTFSAINGFQYLLLQLKIWRFYLGYVPFTVGITIYHITQKHIITVLFGEDPVIVIRIRGATSTLPVWNDLTCYAYVSFGLLDLHSTVCHTYLVCNAGQAWLILMDIQLVLD
ncbi:hypothetical protein ACJX0J_013818, partial [Zea mays]